MSDDVLATKTARPRRVLVTGSAGAIGRRIVPALIERGHRVRGFDRRPSDQLDDQVIGDVADYLAVAEAMAGVDGVIHLAAYPNPADFVTTLVRPNVIGMYHVYEAARQAGVKRVVLASSLQVVSGHRWHDHDRPLTAADGVAPKNNYALAKAWAETTGQMYAREHGISGFAVRVGWFPRDQKEMQRLAGRDWATQVALMHHDAARLFIGCVEADDPPGGFAILFGVSKPDGPPHFDLDTPRRLVGYQPRQTYPEGFVPDEP